jgi:hypothetical protein
LLTFGQTRYRSTFEVALVLLGAVSIEAIWHRLGRHDAGETAPPLASPGVLSPGVSPPATSSVPSGAART